jgi:hypothetical protein
MDLGGGGLPYGRGGGGDVPVGPTVVVVVVIEGVDVVLLEP